MCPLWKGAFCSTISCLTVPQLSGFSDRWQPGAPHWFRERCSEPSAQCRPDDALLAQDVLPAHERAALLAARHRPNAALQVMSQLILAASLRETQVRPPYPFFKKMCM